jgi:hypothetical protein
VQATRLHKRLRDAKKPTLLDADEVFGAEVHLIDAGFYDAVGGKATVFALRGALKLRVDWTVLVSAPEAPDGVRHVVLARYYNVRKTTDGRLRPGRHSDYAREWVLVTGRRIARGDRLSPRVFQRVLCQVEVATVIEDARQRPIPEHARYSKIARIVQVKAGGGSC